MHTYTAVASREGRWWFVEVDGVGATQARNLTGAREMATDLIAITQNLPPDQIEVEVRAVLEADLAEEIAKARAAIREVEELQQSVAQASRTVVRKLVNTAGLTGRDAAIVLGVSPQRVSQLLAD